MENVENEVKMPPPVPENNKDEKMWAMFCHLASLAGYVIPVPIANVIGPLLVWSIQKDDYPLVRDQGRESINFQISMTIYYIIAALLMFVIIGFLILPALMLFQFICVVIASIKSSEGEAYRYPMCIRFIK